MTGYAILIILIIAMGGTIYFLFKYAAKMKKERDAETSRANQYFRAMRDNKELKKKAAEIDKEIEVKRNERKNLSKKDKISLANSRHTDD